MQIIRMERMTCVPRKLKAKRKYIVQKNGLFYNLNSYFYGGSKLSEEFDKLEKKTKIVFPFFFLCLLTNRSLKNAEVPLSVLGSTECFCL